VVVQGQLDLQVIEAQPDLQEPLVLLEIEVQLEALVLREPQVQREPLEPLGLPDPLKNLLHHLTELQGRLQQSV
jgi:hypothetical protein